MKKVIIECPEGYKPIGIELYEDELVVYSCYSSWCFPSLKKGVAFIPFEALDDLIEVLQEAKTSYEAGEM